MLFSMFESRERRDRDRVQILDLQRKYGEKAKEICLERARDRSLSERNRTHWQRIARKI
jgi:hypothetical protein